MNEDRITEIRLATDAKTAYAAAHPVGEPQPRTLGPMPDEDGDR